MMVKKTQIPTTNDYKNKYNYSSSKKVYKNKNNFQQELFEVMSWNTEFDTKAFDLYSDNLENEVKKMFLGEIVKKDHLFSGSLSEIQRENIIKISEMYY